jgi:hypothetical protein
MKTTLLTLLLALSFTARAGTCEVWYHSQVKFQLDFMDILHETHENMTLEDCARQSQLRLGKRARARTLIRNEMRLLTGSRYRYSDRTMFSKGQNSMPSLMD